MTERRPSSERRAEILEAALRIFIKKGYSETRMDDIVQEIGLSKGAIYHYFQSKRDLFIELIERWMDQFSTIESDLNMKGHPSAVIIKRVARYAAIIFRRNPNWFLVEPEIWAFANRDQEIKAITSQLYNRILTVFETLVERGVKYGEFKKVNSRMIALSIMTSLHGMIWFELFQPADFSLEDYVDLNMDFILDAMIIQATE
ncbi:MAG: TetR/AcrR family transcriptional regulator [Candidatus Marinimicrobia bacterium]|nr:TetR/AcrR family transcriptional regulator [Candidatus Neomarinimicrobiota bacterium]